MNKKLTSQGKRSQPQREEAPATPTPGLLTMDEAIATLKTTRPTFYRWLRSGRLKGTKIGRQWRFTREDMDRFLKGQGPQIDLPTAIDPLIDNLKSKLKELGARGAAEQEQDKATQVVLLMVRLALAMKASDIHIDPQEGNVHLRLRVDGALHLVAQFDSRLLGPIVERWKTMAAMDVHEKNVPQDGRILLDEDAADLRVCCVPVCLGESIVARILLPELAVALDLAKLPYADADRERINRWLQAPWGMILLTGPTGCGKTTTLYSCLRRLTNERTKVLSIEDPVEYILPGVTQIQTNPKAGVTFERALRSVFRCDPDVIMVGEIRNAETMALCFQAALTGHLVITTLHTDEAASALRRLIDIGCEPFLAAEGVKLIVAQRLVRTLCADCATEETPPPDLLARAEKLANSGGIRWDALPRKFRRPNGCTKCGQLGFRGRTLIAETLEISPEIAAALRRKASTEEIRTIAVGQGMTTMAADGIRRAAQGQVSMAEVLSTLGGINY